MADLGNYIYFAADELSGTTLTSVSNVAALNGVVLTQNNATNLWAANSGWLTFTGLEHFSVELSTLTTVQQDFFKVSETELMLYWAQCLLDTSDSYTNALNRMTVIAVGQNNSTDHYYEHSLSPTTPAITGGTDQIFSLVKDSGLTPKENFANTTNGPTGNTVWSDFETTCAGFIDNRTTHKQYRFMNNAALMDGKHNIDEVGALAPVNGFIRVGGSIGTAGAFTNPYVSQLRRIGFMKYDIDASNYPPLGIDKSIQQLFDNQTNSEGGVPLSER